MEKTVLVQTKDSIDIVEDLTKLVYVIDMDEEIKTYCALNLTKLAQSLELDNENELPYHSGKSTFINPRFGTKEYIFGYRLMKKEQ